MFDYLPTNIFTRYVFSRTRDHHTVNSHRTDDLIASSAAKCLLTILKTSLSFTAAPVLDMTVMINQCLGRLALGPVEVVGVEIWRLLAILLPHLHESHL